LELNNLNKLMCELMDLSVSYMDEGDTVNGDKVYELIHTFFEQTSYDYDTFVGTGTLVTV